MTAFIFDTKSRLFDTATLDALGFSLTATSVPCSCHGIWLCVQISPLMPSFVFLNPYRCVLNVRVGVYFVRLSTRPRFIFIPVSLTGRWSRTLRVECTHVELTIKWGN